MQTYTPIQQCWGGTTYTSYANFINKMKKEKKNNYRLSNAKNQVVFLQEKITNLNLKKWNNAMVTMSK